MPEIHRYALEEKRWWNSVADAYSKNVESEGSKGFTVRDKVLNPCLFSALGNVQGKRILDYGCGDGWLVKNLSEKGADVSGVDISDKFIEIAQKKHPGLKFKVVDVDKVDFPDKYFDIVISNIVLNVTRFYREVLSETYRVLKPGAVAIVVIMHPDLYKKKMINPDLEEESFEIKVSGAVPVLYHKRKLSIYERAFSELGFQIINRLDCLADTSLGEEFQKYAKNPYFVLYRLQKDKA